jgi:hypothetical protein
MVTADQNGIDTRRESRYLDTGDGGRMAQRGERMSKVKLALIGIAVVMLIAVFAWPVKIACPHGPCTTAPDADGYVHRYYEVKPLVPGIIEKITRNDFGLYYSSGDERGERVRSS